MTFSLHSIEKKITGYVSGKPDILLVFLFGSVIKNNVHSESDIDVAILFQRDISIDQSLKIEDDLTSLLQNESDIVNLNRSSPIIKMQVLRTGKKIFERKPGIYSRFFVRTLNEYDDLKRVRSINEKSILRGRIYG